MQKAQLTQLQIGLASMGIEQGAADQIQGHGVDAEITPGQVIGHRAEAHLRIFGWHRVGLAAGGGHIQQHLLAVQVEFELNGAVSAVLLAALHHTLTQLASQGVNQLLNQL